MTLHNAECTGADPSMFDATAGDLVFAALTYCGRCRVTDACHDLVKPDRVYYDGVVAGVVWRNGEPVEPALFE